MSTDTITKTVILDASREMVWEFLTRKEKLAQWFHPADADLADGQDYALLETADDSAAMKVCWGTVLQMDQPSTMKWSFTINPLGGAMTTVTWTLQEVHGGTQLTLKHEGIGEAAGQAALGLAMALDKGWDQHFANLRSAQA